MKDFDLEGLSREMPYKMPEHFLDDMTERVISQIGKQQRKQRRDHKSSPCLPAQQVLQRLPCCSCIRSGAVLISPIMTASHNAQALMTCFRI